MACVLIQNWWERFNKMPLLWLIGLLFLPASAMAGTLSWVSSERWVTVAKVYDGDTFETRKGEKIRLLNVNTPEVQHRDSRAQMGGDEASLALNALISGQQVRLRTDRETKDHYGRTLAQVWMQGGLWVNAWLLNQGYAHMYNFEPNTRWAKALQAEEKVAREAGLRIWRLPSFKVLDANRVSKSQLGEFRVVKGRVNVSGLKTWSFQLGTLRVTIPRAYRTYFKQLPDLKGHPKVTIRGKIRVSNKQQLFMALHSPFDLEIEP